MKKRGDRMKEALIKLLRVKTVITLILTVVFAFLCLSGRVDAREFVTIFTVVISFYFGTQHERAEEVMLGNQNANISGASDGSSQTGQTGQNGQTAQVIQAGKYDDSEDE